MEEQSDEGEPVKVGESRWKALVVACQPTEARSPSKGAFDDPTFWKQDEAAFSFRKLYDHEVHAILRCGSRRIFPGVTLIDVGRSNIYDVLR